MIETAGTFTSLRYDEAAAEWRAGDPAWDAPAPTSNRPPYGPFRSANGELIWTNAVREPLDPPYPLVRGEDGWLPVRITEGDNGWAVPAPDGRRFLVSAQRPDATPFVKDLYVVGLDWIEGRAHAAPPRRIVDGTEQMGIYEWSPDGLAIAVVVRGMRDRLVIVRPSGEPVAEVPFYEVVNLSWCGNSHRLAALVNTGDRSRLVLVTPESGEASSVAEDALAEVVACSPDGAWVAYLGAVDLEPRLHLVEVESGEVIVLPDHDVLSAASDVRWVPDPVSSGPLRLSIEAVEESLIWGESASLTGLLSGPGASALAGEIEWSSSDSWVVSVTPGGRIHANRRGTAEIVASVHGWVSDTLRVIVEGDRPPELVLEDRFEEIDETRWSVVGVPSPVVRETPDGPARWLRGDGRYTDGLISRDSFALTDGVRLDLEFSFAPRRHEHGSLTVCILDRVSSPGVEGPGASRENACFVYPARELEKYDPGRARLMSAGGRDEISLPSAGDGAWTRVTLEVRPDGAPALWINGELMATGALRLQGTDRATWRVRLAGHSAEPPLLVRNVTLWLGDETDGEP